ncbi:MAG: PAS domain-containing protein [Bacteroidota bacterium]
MNSDEAVLHSDFNLYAVFLLKHVEAATEAYNHLSAEYGLASPVSTTVPGAKPLHVNHSLQSFLQSLVEGKAAEYERQQLAEWKTRQALAEEHAYANATQMLDGLLVRKLLLVQFLPHFTSDPHELASLCAQIEKFHHILNKQLFKICLEMQKTALVEKQAALEATNEELQASQEEVQTGSIELQAINEALLELNDSLTEKKRFIEKITETSPDVIYIFDLTLHKTTYVNRNIFLHILGLRKDEFYALEPEAIKDIFYPGDYEKREQYYRDFLLAEEEIREIELRLKHADGRYHSFLLKGTVFRRTPQGVPDQIISIFQDITRLKQTEADLRDTLSTLQNYNEELEAINLELADRKHFIEQVTNTIPSYIFIFDLVSFKASYFNRNLLQDLGYSLDEIQEQGISMIKKLFYPGDYERRNHFYANFSTADGQEIREIELKMLHADGWYRSFLIRNTVFRRSPHGIPNQVIGIAQDITHLKEIEADLRGTLLQLQLSNEQTTIANEKLLNASNELAQRNHFIEKVANAVPNTFFIIDIPSLQPVYVNKDKIHTIGFTREEFYNLTVSELKKHIHSNDYEVYCQFYQDFISAEDKEVREINIRIKHEDGGHRFFLVSGSVFRRTDEGMPDQVLSISQDITHLKQTEDELRKALFQLNEANEALTRTEETLKELNTDLEERIGQSMLELAASNERFELVAQATNDAIWDRNYGEDYIHWNQSFEQIFGYINDEEKKNPTVDTWFERMHPEDRESVRQAVEHSIYTSNTSWGSEYRFLRSDGTYAYVLSRAVILYDDFQKPHRLVGSMMDISHLKETEFTLQKQNKELVKINDDLDNFIYVASHDLKHPVTNLEGLLAMLREHLQPQQDEESEKWLSLMDVSTVRLKKTIQDIAEISKVQKGLEEAYEVLYFASVLDEVKIDIANLIAQAGATITTDFKVKEIGYSHKNLRSILYNLLSNALKYRSPDRPVVVQLATYWQEGNIILTVQDNGLGLNAQQQAKLFTMFKRLHTHVEGTGIGLYMIKRIIENNGGRIFVTSESQVGTTFTINFKPTFAHEKT